MNAPSRHIAALAIVFVVMGAVDSMLAPVNGQSPLAILYGLVIAAILFGWCRAHAKANEIEAPVGSATLAALIPPVGVPLYFLRTRPFAGALVSIAKAVAVAFVFIVLYSLTWSLCASLWSNA